MQVLKENKGGWLNTVNKKINSLKAEGQLVAESEAEEVQESLLTEYKLFSRHEQSADTDDIFNKLVPGAYFATNDTNRSRYTIKNLYLIDGEVWATFHSIHANATEYAVKVEDLEKALTDHRIIILSREDIANLKLNHGGQSISFNRKNSSDHITLEVGDSRQYNEADQEDIINLAKEYDLECEISSSTKCFEVTGEREDLIEYLAALLKDEHCTTEKEARNLFPDVARKYPDLLTTAFNIRR